MKNQELDEQTLVNKIYKVTTRGFDLDKKGAVKKEYARNNHYVVVARSAFEAVGKCFLGKDEITDEIELVSEEVII